MEPIGRRPASMVELPLSALQQRMWFMCTAYPGDASPIIYVAWRLRGPLMVDALIRAAGAVVDRHESLRTLFVDRDGGPVQVVRPPKGIDVERVDLSDLPAAQRVARAQDFLAGHVRTLLDLERGPLVGSWLLRLADDDHVWFMTMHHILADGASLPIVAHEVRAYYRAFVNGVEPDLPELPVQPGDIAVWQESAAHDEGLRYWRERLAGVPVLELPTDLPRPPEKSTRAASLTHDIDGELAGRVERMARGERATLFMALLAALDALLALRSGQLDFCVGTPVAGRTRVELEPMVGLFANTLAMRADLAGNPSFRDLLTRTRTSTIEALGRQDVPFGRIVTELGLLRDPARTQVFQVIFVLHTELREEGEELGLPGLRVEPFGAIGPQILHDLVVHAWRSSVGLSMEFRYDSALFTADTVARLAQRYENLLRSVVDDADLRLYELALTSGQA